MADPPLQDNSYQAVVVGQSDSLPKNEIEMATQSQNNLTPGFNITSNPYQESKFWLGETHLIDF